MIERLFHHANRLHDMSVEAARPDEKQFIQRRAPTIELSYKDGTKYEIRDLETLKDVIPGRGKPIDSLSVHSRVGDFTCSIDLHTRRYIEGANVRASGLEDKVGHFVETVVAELLQERDITVLARRIWVGAWAFLFSSLLWVSIGWRSVHDFATGYGLFMIVILTALFASIAIEMFRGRWLPPVAFLWGEDGLRAKQAKTVVTLALATVPLGILINLISALILR